MLAEVLKRGLPEIFTKISKTCSEGPQSPTKRKLYC